jgi:hypothetical protein
VCGPSCQKSKVSDELKQKYLDAQTNVKIAPQELEQTKKNYYTFTKGATYYDNMLEKELTKTADDISKLIGNNFNDNVTSAKTMNQYLNIALINSSHTEDLLKHYKDQNEKLRLKLRNNHGDILTNDRKTFYEVQELERLESWYRIWYRMFYILVFVFNICWLVCPSEINLITKIILSISLVFYPYYIDPVLRFIYGFVMDIYKSLPKNVYNDL